MGYDWVAIDGNFSAYDLGCRSIKPKPENHFVNGTFSFVYLVGLVGF